MEPDKKKGEIAFIVADPYQSLGLGTKLVDYMIEICQDLEMETIYGMVLPDNARALRLLKKKGFTITHMEDGTLRAMLDLRGAKSEAKKDGVKGLTRKTLD